MRYRVNYGNGQVSRVCDTKREAIRLRADGPIYREYAFIQFEDPNTREWFSCS